MDSARFPDVDSEHRRVELLAALAGVRRRIVDAALAAGRSPTEVRMLAVTKGFPARDLALLLGLGVTDVAENRDQEARAKLSEVDLGSARLHFIGQLQTNKAKSVARYAHAVHSVDRLELATALSNAAQRAERQLDVFLQVNLDESGDRDAQPGARGGVAGHEVLRLADEVATQSNLSLRGVMAVAPLDGDPGVAFEKLAQISQQLCANHPYASSISAGMSSDFDIAIKYGSTHVRVGSALLGHRSHYFR